MTPGARGSPAIFGSTGGPTPKRGAGLGGARTKGDHSSTPECIYFFCEARAVELELEETTAALRRTPLGFRKSDRRFVFHPLAGGRRLEGSGWKVEGWCMRVRAVQTVDSPRSLSLYVPFVCLPAWVCT